MCVDIVCALAEMKYVWTENENWTLGQQFTSEYVNPLSHTMHVSQNKILYCISCVIHICL